MLHTTRRGAIGGFGATMVAHMLPDASYNIRSLSAGADTSEELLRKSVEAAVAAGADYADARWTHTFEYYMSPMTYSPSEHIAIGVRALVNGCWGFAASAMCTNEEAARLGQAASMQAKANINGVLDAKFQQVDVAEFKEPAIVSEWTAPVKEDPFEIYPYEVRDFLHGIVMFISRFRDTSHHNVTISARKQIKKFVSSNGSYLNQTVFRTSGGVSFVLQRGTKKKIELDTISVSGLGLEYFRDQNIRELATRGYEEALRDVSLQFVPIDVGRYKVLVNAVGVAGLIGGSIGCATELDRITGINANSVGTSYIDKPAEMIGSFKLGNSLLTVEAERSSIGGVASVKWDDEGKAPSDFNVVDKGILNRVQCGRGTSEWVQGTGHGSTGSSVAVDATLAPLISSGNLNMLPSDSNDNIDSLMSAMEEGILIKDAGSGLDHQLINGMITGEAYLVKKGKPVARIANAGVWFRTPELWNSLAAIGGRDSVRKLGLGVSKGEPEQRNFFSISAVPVIFSDATVIDVLRR